MFGSSIIDIAIGMVFIYLLLSLICSAANELIERYSRKRALNLETGILEMLRTPGLVKQIYEHPLVYSLYSKPYETGAKTLPSYIPARNFALALMDIAAPESLKGATGMSSTSPPSFDGDAIRAFIESNNQLPDPIKKALVTFTKAGGDDAAKLRENIENWFDSSMDRVSGFYKRRTQMIILILGLLVSIGMNVNSVTLVRSLSTDRAMRDSLVTAAQEYARSNPPPANPAASPTPPPAAAPAASSTDNKCTADTPQCRIQNNLNEIKALELPIGWSAQARTEFANNFPGSLGVGLIGWIVTALALSLGAPFWFDLLNKFVVVRATVKPKEKSPEEASKD